MHSEQEKWQCRQGLVFTCWLFERPVSAGGRDWGENIFCLLLCASGTQSPRYMYMPFRKCIVFFFYNKVTLNDQNVSRNKHFTKNLPNFNRFTQVSHMLRSHNA